MEIINNFKKALKAIDEYKSMIDNHKGSKDYGNDIVTKYNEIGYNIETLTSEIEDIFTDEKKYDEYFENDELLDEISDTLTDAFNKFSKLLSLKKCEEKVALAYEWLFEVMLFTTDDEEIKSRITLNSNGIKVKSNSKPFSGDVKEGDKVKIAIISSGKEEDITLVAEEIVDDFIYTYLGDKEDEHDLIIFNKEVIRKVF